MGRRDVEQVVGGVVRVPNIMVNAYLLGEPLARSGEWLLVDAGLSNAAEPILRAAQRRFGTESRPAAIVLTHGHFDHIGAVEELAEFWDVRVFAHPLEMPYITGQNAYPPPDPAVGGGMMSRMARLYPSKPIDLGQRARVLASDGSLPWTAATADWRWIHTPGHTPGHISLFRDRDRTLIAGDAFVTVKQESALAVLTQRKKVHRPPAYFTSDWAEAWDSVRRLADLNPQVAATGHGMPMRGEHLRKQLDKLVRHFDKKAVPKHGRYVQFPALADENGAWYIPPKRHTLTKRLAQGLGLAALIAVSAALIDLEGLGSLLERANGNLQLAPK